MSPPPPFAERRRTHRRAADRLAHIETVLLAKSLDILAADSEPEARLAGLLALVAETVGARRAAVVAGEHERRVAVAVRPDEDPREAEGLAAWLDAWAPRSRAQRAAAPRAQVAFVVGDPEPSRRARTVRRSAEHHYALVPVPSAGEVVLGFDFADERAAAGVAERLPPQLARHAGVALTLVTERLATDREIAELRARDEQQGRFVSTVAHELRTPLTGLAGYLELILAGDVDDPAVERDFLERSRGIVDTITGLVSDLLDRSRIESGTLRLEIEPFSIAEAAGRVVNALEPIALDRGIGLRAQLPPRLRTATADRRRVEQVITNLIGNALKFSPAGTTVELVAWFAGPVALVCVRDEGAGIEPADRARIFEPFQRLAAHDRVAGTGLGLPIARDLASAMGGALDVSSVPGGGSSFVLALPGPSGATGSAIGRALRDALAGEEVRLGQRAIVRRAAGDPGTAEPPGGRRQPTRLRPGDDVDDQAEPSVA
ncbi:MAG TPA: HAMP domain-containing sensor histidine kinase [Candidatus Limnocylindrales bacterium]